MVKHRQALGREAGGSRGRDAAVSHTQDTVKQRGKIRPETQNIKPGPGKIGQDLHESEELPEYVDRSQCRVEKPQAGSTRRKTRAMPDKEEGGLDSALACAV